MVVLAKLETTVVNTARMAIEVALHTMLRKCTCMLLTSPFVYLSEVLVSCFQPFSDICFCHVHFVILPQVAFVHQHFF